MNWVELANMYRATGGTIWLQVALLAGLLFISLYKPERIRFPTLFRMSYVCLALAVIVPPVMEICTPLLLGMGTNAFGNLRNRPQGFVISLPAVVGPVFLGTSIILMLSAIAPHRQQSRKPAAPPQRHPLD
jgi:hypothetical protein